MNLVAGDISIRVKREKINARQINEFMNAFADLKDVEIKLEGRKLNDIVKVEYVLPEIDEKPLQGEGSDYEMGVYGYNKEKIKLKYKILFAVKLDIDIGVGHVRSNEQINWTRCVPFSFVNVEI